MTPDVSGFLPTSPSASKVSVVPSATRAIPLTFEKMMDYQLDKVIQNTVSTFATISSILSTINDGLLPDLGVSSSQFEAMPSDDLIAATSVDSLITITFE